LEYVWALNNFVWDKLEWNYFCCLIWKERYFFALRLKTFRNSVVSRRHFAGGGAPGVCDRRRLRSAALQANFC